MMHKPWIIRLALVVIGPAFVGSGVARAQASAREAVVESVEVAPIDCSWKTSRGSVLIGERFTLTLTCGIVETSSVTVVPDLNQLQPTAIQLPPFEVISGVRHNDIQAPSRRYIQHEYSVRLLGETFFGKDVDIPALKVTYHIQSSIGGGSTGRDQIYVLPALPMRVASLVPTKTNDIRDASADTFADIERRRARATGELVAAAILGAFAVIFLLLAFVRIASRYQERTATAARSLSTGAVLAGCVSSIRLLKSAVARDGWTPDCVGRALTPLRIGGAVALGKPVAQVMVDPSVNGREGQLVVGRGMLRRTRALISAPTAADAIAKALGNSHGLVPNARTQAILADLQESLRVLTAARYGRTGHPDATALDAAVDRGADALRRLRFVKLWPMFQAGSSTKSAVSGLKDA